MERVPEPHAPSHVLHWIAYEHDAAWTAKLAILRAAHKDDIAHFGACLREHERHAAELARLARMNDRHAPLPTDATCVTGEPHVVGAVADGRALLETMDDLEAARVRRYEAHRAHGTHASEGLAAVLERHLADARARLEALRRLRGSRCAVAA